MRAGCTISGTKSVLIQASQKVNEMMKSLVEDALAREPTAGAAVSETAAYGPDQRVDAELEAILRTLKTNIKIIGVGGAGSNTIARIYDEGIVGAELIAANTDAQHLLQLRAPHKLLLGRRVTRGLGAGALPQVGEEAAREAEEELKKILVDTHICFITCGLGGGTGTGGAAVVARTAKEMGALTISVCTLPFRGEGKMRMENAEWGLERLRDASDTVIVIPNDKLLETVPRLSLNAAFKVADEVLMRSIKGLTEVITRPGLVNLDFNDIKTIMKGAGVAMIGLGESDAPGDERIQEAIDQAINSPLLEVDISQANGVLIDVIGGTDMTISEAERAAEEIQARVGQNARIIWGAAVDPAMDKTVRVMLVATGVKSKQILGKPQEKRFRGVGEVEMVH
jgi:cell division protein FtsZ